MSEKSTKKRRSCGRVLIVEERYRAWAMGEPVPEQSAHELTLSTVSQFSEKYPEFPEGGLRWAIFNEEKNGLKKAGAIVRICSSPPGARKKQSEAA